LLSRKIRRLDENISTSNDLCKEHRIDEEQPMIKIDYNAKLKNILDEFLRSNQVCFDKFKVQCGNHV